MIIKKIILENIRSYDYQEVELKEGSTLLSGDIGSGKTSVLLAIEFALFGLQPGQRGNSLLKNGKTEGKVSMEFDLEGNNILIERTLKKNKTISQDSSFITINGEKRELSVTELKSKVLELLDYPRELSKKQNLLYKFTVYTPQEEMKQIILEDPDVRINTLRHVFGIDKYKRILENVSVLTQKIREEKRVKETIILNLEEDKLKIVSKEKELEIMKDNLILVSADLSKSSKLRKKIELEKEEIFRKIEEKSKLSQELEKTKLVLLTKNDSIKSNERLIESLKIQIQEYEHQKFDPEKLKSLEKEIINLKKQKEGVNKFILEAMGQISTLLSKNEENEKLQKNMSSLEICPTCLQDVNAVYRSNVLNKLHNDLSENTKKLMALSSEKRDLLESMKKIDLEISSKEREVNDLKLLKIRLETIDEKVKRVQDLEKINNALIKDLSLLERQSQSLSNFVFELSKFDKLFEMKQEELKKAFYDEKMFEVKVAELKKEIEWSSKQVLELKEEVKGAEAIKEKLVYLADLENWLSKKFTSMISFVEKNVMAKLKSEFSKVFQEWFSMLVSENFNVSLREDFTPVIEQQDYELDYAYLSGGERTAIALAYRLALNKVINSIMSKIKTKNLVILDEPTDGFSEQQLDKMRSVLEQLNAKQLIIVSHEQKIEGFVENVVRFKKENGVSKRV